MNLVAIVEAMVDESGQREGFDAAAWLARWFTEPLAAFGGRPPADLLATPEGEAQVATVLRQMQSGAFA